MNVLSLFDGISCGRIALERIGIPIERYVAYEYDEETIKKYPPYGVAAYVTSHNYPMIEQMGNVFDGDFTEYIGFDLLIGGSPCTNWSIAKAGVGEKHAPKRETKASGIGWDLFCQYTRALREAKPRYFLYENNESINDSIKDAITYELGVEPIMIDSADFSAQKRKRCYWTNIPINEWKQQNIQFSDIMDTAGPFLTRSIEQYADCIQNKELRGKCIGNGWTVDVIAHILSNLKNGVVTE